jgi:MFS family permease
VVIGLWIRLTVSESPVFLEARRKAEARKSPVAEKAPIVTLLRLHRREVLIAMGARMGENVSYYVITAFILVYLTGPLGLSKSYGLNAVLIASVVHFVSIPLWGALSDRVGRRAVYLFGAVGVGVWIFLFFTLLDTRSFGAIVLATSVGLLLHGAMYGPQAAFFSELFGTRVRYSGASVGYQLASTVAGALAPLIATALLQRFDSTVPVALYVGFACLLSVIAVVVAKETRGVRLEKTADEASEVPA